MSGGSQKAPTPYQPAAQPQADASYQTGVSQLSNAGTSLYNTVNPELAATTSAVQNNPYQAQALAGAKQASNTATSTVAPQQLAGASQDAQIAALSSGLAPAYAGAATTAGATGYGETQSAIPGATAGAAAAPGVFNQAQSYIPITSNPELLAGLQVLQTGFDPQSQLYNQQYQQMQDQTNAINAQNGVAGSPFAAGLSAQNSQNFNTNWQNQQLSRELQALGGYDSAASTAAGNVANLQSTGTTDFNNLNNSAVGNLNSLVSTGTGALNSGINTGVNALTALGGQAIAGNTAASDLGTAALNTQAQAAQLPSDVYLQQQQADLAAIGSQISGTNAALAPTQQAVADQGAYLNIGQTASQGAIQAANVNNQASQASAMGFGNLFGGILGMFNFTNVV